MAKGQDKGEKKDAGKKKDLKALRRAKKEAKK